MSPKSPTTPTHRLILTALATADVPLSIAEISENIGCSPLTARLALQNMTKEKLVVRSLQGQKAYFTSKDFKTRSTEREKYGQWLETSMKMTTYEQAIAAGAKAFAASGKKMTKAQVKEVFPQTDESMAGLIFFIWDTMENGNKATRRIHKMLHGGAESN